MTQLELFPIPRRRRSTRRRRHRATNRGVRYAVWPRDQYDARPCGHLHYRMQGLRRCLSGPVRWEFGPALTVRATEDFGRSWRALTPEEHSDLGKALGLVREGLTQ